MAKELVSKTSKLIKAFLTRRMQIQSDRIPYSYNKKLINACLAEASIFFKPERPWGWPTNLMIEPTNYCNLRCALCPVTTGLDRPPGNMDFELFKKVIDEIGDYIFTMLLWDWGEPFLNRSVYEMITYAKRKDIKIISSTNGHLFSLPENADRLIRSGLDSIIFAVDGVTQETYERYRQGGTLETALQGVRNVVDRKKALGLKTPFVIFRFIVMRHNEHEIPMVKDLANFLGVDALSLKTMNPYSQDPYVGIQTDMKEKAHDFLPENRRYHRFKYDSTNSNRIRLKRNPCRHLWNTSTIHCGGAVSPCTYDPKEKQVLGELSINTFRDIWLGAEYRNMRRQFRKDWERIDYCRECSYAYKGGCCSSGETTAAVFF